MIYIRNLMMTEKPTHSRVQSKLSMLATLNPGLARRQILDALERSKNAQEGQGRRAAHMLGVSYETLWRVARRLGLSDQMPRKGKGAGRPARGDEEK